MILTDNGSEFSNPSAIDAPDGSRRTSVYCFDACASWQKGDIVLKPSLLAR